MRGAREEDIPCLYGITIDLIDWAGAEDSCGNVSCINCDFEDKRDWPGRIMGRGLHGALSALLARIKHKYRLFRDDTLLMEL
jgi:hypothetical protein